MPAFDDLFNTLPDVARHRATLWWGTYNVVYGVLYARQIELQVMSMAHEAMHGTCVTDRELQHIHTMATAAATLAHGGPAVLPQARMFEPRIKEG